MNHANFKSIGLFVLLSLFFVLSCNNDDVPDIEAPVETGNTKSFNLFSASTGQVSGSVKFSELSDNTTKVEISLSGLNPAGNHPTHIHNNSWAKGGNIAVSLENVSGASGKSETIVSEKDDGTAITYPELIDFNGHVNVHESAANLSLLVAQGDIGPNELTLNVEDYDLNEIGGSGISGDVTFVERVSGEILAIIALENTPSGGQHPAHIHLNSIVSGGGISISFNPVNGDTGLSLTDFSELDNGTPITFSQLQDFDGHVKVHLSAADLATVVATGDIGSNLLTGEMESYPLMEAAVAGISGNVWFKERKNGKTLVEIELENTPDGGVHPAHIHANSAVEGGTVIIPLSNLNGTTGKSLTDVTADKDENPLTYDDLIVFDGHVMVHLSAEQISTIVARGDIGNNTLTGEETIYDIMELNGSGVSGTFTLQQRKSGFSLATIMLSGTPTDGNHPAHIHTNSIESGGGIVISLKNVDGNTGFSSTNIEKTDAEEDITYSELLEFDGHVKVHLSPQDLPTVVAGGNIGLNATTGSRVSYADDIRPILDTNCQLSGCHGSATGIPSWATYTTVSTNAASIKNMTGSKMMPPASSGKSLTDEQIEKIADWVDDGAQNN
jgi:Cu/Zn superoxide dismutase